MSKTEKKLKAVSLILIAVLIFTAVFNVIFVGRSVFAGADVSQNTTVIDGNKFVKSDLNFDSVREAYFNHELVEKNTASYDGDRWVIVELKGETLYDSFSSNSRYNDFASYGASVEGQRAQANIKSEHTDFLRKLDRHGIDYQLKYAYTAVTNAMAIKVCAEGYNAIKKMSEVESVSYVQYYDVPKVAVENDANVYTTGIYKTDGIDEKGEGMVVAILDTGLDHTHEAFSTAPKDHGRIKKSDVETLVRSGDGAGRKIMAQGTADDFYYNEKVPFAYDYADDDPNVYPSYSSHGTHVAGIVAGKSNYVVNEEIDPITGETVTETFKGVAPEAQLVICKVFTDNFDSKVLGGADTMGILAALNDCALLGVDIINMSLGTSAGFTEETDDTEQYRLLSEVYNHIEDLGISLVVAASNDYSSGFGGANGTNLASNPDSGTVGSPSTYSAALSVASINGRKASYLTAKNKSYTDDRSHDPVAFITNSSNEFSQEYNFVDQLYELAAKSRGVDKVPKGTDLRFKFVSVNGVGKTTDYTPIVQSQLNNKGNYDGVIALVQRGDITFADKVRNAKSKGADACIIYNNVSGTIRMSLGDVEDPIPTCSISMDAGKAFISTISSGYGEITVNSDYLAGPFMSEFSSWGPTPNLQLKPEITAHGGEIISAVASGYDKLSGTSMAAPNMAGAIALLRQNLKTKNPGLTGKDLNAYVNQMLMSTATIAKNEENNPYSPRKQGAGLAGIVSAINSESYITVPDGNGGLRDKTKIELYDDPEKEGVYTLEFYMNNLTDKTQTYSPTTYVMTETMSSDNKTVAEKAYMLTDNCNIEYLVGADKNSLNKVSGDIQLGANATVFVRVTITLNQTAKNYLDKNFANGMYVEGFVSMQATGDTKITVGLPYLAFYGDWTDAPLFDYDVYEVAEDEQKTDLDDYYKRKASSQATMAVGMYYEDTYILPLGSYIYTQAEEDVPVYPDRDKIAISMYDDNACHSIYELYMVYAGLLRGAKEMNVVITDDATGEVIYTDSMTNVRKAYAGAGANRGAPVMLEINPNDWGLRNNSRYSVSLAGKLDYKDDKGEYVVPERNSWEFPFTVDYEDPELIGYKIRFMSYTENKVLKYRIYMDVEVRDNQYVQTVLPCYLKTRPTGNYNSEGKPITENVLTLIPEYPIAVNGQKGESSTVSFEITDIYEEYVKTGNMYIEVQDYAMNSNNYQILPGENRGEDAMNDPDKVEFQVDEQLRENGVGADAFGTYKKYILQVSPYSLYTLKPTSDDVVMKSLSWNIDEKKANVAKAQADEIFAGVGGRTTIRLQNTTTDISKKRTYAEIIVQVQGTSNNKKPTLRSLKFTSGVNKSGSVVSLNPSGSETPLLELNPNQSMQLTWEWSPWYCDEPEVVWTTDNDQVVSVTQNGTITAISKGTAYITIASKEKPGDIYKAIKVEVGRPYRVSNFTLYDYYGTGKIEIPSNLNIMYLDEDCFKGNTDITEVILPSSLTEIPEHAFLGCRNLTKVVIPGQCTAVKTGAFEGCTSLVTVELGLFVDSERNELGPEYAGTITLGRNAFKDCEKLKNITNQGRITTIYERAFENCKALEAIDISNVRAIANGAFLNCATLKTVTTSEHTVFGAGTFENCSQLRTFAFKGNSVPDNTFKGCTRLETVTFEKNITSIGENAFEGTKIANITLPGGNIAIDRNAFKGCSALQTITLSKQTKLLFDRNTPFAGCTNFNAYAFTENDYYTLSDGVLYEGDTLIAVPTAKTEFNIPTNVTKMADGALSGVNVTSLDLSNITSIDKYAFSGNTVIESVVLPSGLTAIPEGLFDGCSKLNSVTAGDNFSNVQKIGDYAFRGCSALGTFGASNVSEIGVGAFEESGLTAMPGGNITSIGANAFAKTKLGTVTINVAVSLGDSAFANISTLQTVNFAGGLKSVTVGDYVYSDMGENVFAGSDALSEVIFGAGTKSIGAGAFASQNSINTALTVTLASTVWYIGREAFLNHENLTINLGNVEYIDALAFAYIPKGASANAKGGLTVAELGNVKQIGYGAFANNRLVSVDLSKAELIGAFAFNYNETLTSVTLGALRRIGEYAFIKTGIETITLPATFNSRTYNYIWSTRDENGDVERENLSRKELTFAPGALSGMEKLTAINVAGEGDDNAYVSIDGVLYVKTYREVSDSEGNISYEFNGYVLLQYPSARAGEEYTVVDGTVMIGESAFEYTQKLKKVTFPYTVSTIGSAAFYGSECTEYVFNSVEAPTLLASFVTPDDFAGNTLDMMVLRMVFNRNPNEGNAGALTNFYCNFVGYAVLSDTALWGVGADGATDLGLTATIPLNGRGYDYIWDIFFTTVKRTQQNLPDNTSHEAIKAIQKLPTKEEILATNDYDLLKTDSAIGILASEARKAYNKIVLPDQIEVMSEYYDVLASIEQALRTKKADLGHPVRIKELALSKRPNKMRYNVGESFDPTGMVLSAIYEDGSEVALTGTNYQISPSVIASDTTRVTITYVDPSTNQVVTKTIAINVNIPIEPDPDENPDGPTEPEESDGKLGGGAIAGIVVGVVLGVALIAGVAVAVIILKKKKAGATQPEEKEQVKSDSEETPETADNAEGGETADNADEAQDGADIAVEYKEASDQPQSQTADEETADGASQSEDNVADEETADGASNSEDIADEVDDD